MLPLFSDTRRLGFLFHAPEDDRGCRHRYFFDLKFHEQFYLNKSIAFAPVIVRYRRAFDLRAILASGPPGYNGTSRRPVNAVARSGRHEKMPLRADRRLAASLGDICLYRRQLLIWAASKAVPGYTALGQSWPLISTTTVTQGIPV